MLNLKDRKPAEPGSRSFFPMKLFLTIIIVFVILLGWYGRQLVIAVVPEGDRKPFAVPTSKGDTWNISLTHSVEKTTWEEFFRINDVHNMTMTHTRFESLGWGYPYSASDGKLSRTGDGRFNLEMNRPYKDVSLRISEQAMQHIVHHDEDYDLVAMYGQGTAVTIKAQYRYEYWYENYF